MYVATLIAPPGSSALTAQVAAIAKGHLNGEAVRWLGANQACDIPFQKGASFDVKDLWQGLQDRQIDLVVQPIQGRRKQVLLADMDSTMIPQECIDELAAEAGVGPRVADITARAMNGELDFEAALRERVGLLKDLPTDVIQTVLNTRITLMPGGPTLLATMKKHGAYAALVSGGFTDFTTAIATRLGFDENRANTLCHADGKLTGRYGLPILGQQAKVDALHEITQRLGLSAADVIAVGDGANDLGMLQLAGSGVALHAKPAVAAQSKLKLNFADLTGLLYLQGYTQDQFIVP